ncbi:Mpv17 / PMP22 family protein [Paramecium bursaria Chlorella virus NE-JV-1]|nr:Mpv17 / PMP22 family protein [Paramecium bursaria Chlorella virus NE-JV-1]
MRLAAISGMTAFGVDAVLQHIGKQTYDRRRAFRVTSYAFISAFPQNAYFKNLGKICKNPFEKTIVNQVFFAPLNISFGIAWNLALQNQFSLIVPEIRKNMLPGLIEGSVFWIPINAIGFKFIRPCDQFFFFKLIGIPYKMLFVHRTT